MKTTVEHYYAVRLGRRRPYFLIERSPIGNIPVLFEDRADAEMQVARLEGVHHDRAVVVVEVRETRKRSLKRTRAQKAKKG